tara:strand:+ start:1428 stop:1631 length:204 start_codon:yes stop_codon:yes gene_type:complete
MQAKQTMTGKESLDAVGLRRICCRRMLLTHVPVIEDILAYSNIDSVLDDCNTTFCCRVAKTRSVACD